MASVRVLALPSRAPRRAPRPAPTRAHVVAPPPPRQTPYVWVMLVSDTPLEGQNFGKVVLEGCTDVADVTKSACKEFGWGTPTQVRLYVAAAGGDDEPSADAIKSALSGARLQASWKLDRAGITEGSWLLARVPPPPAAAPGASRRRAGVLARAHSRTSAAHPSLTRPPPHPRWQLRRVAAAQRAAALRRGRQTASVRVSPRRARPLTNTSCGASSRRARCRARFPSAPLRLTQRRCTTRSLPTLHQRHARMCWAKRASALTAILLSRIGRQRSLSGLLTALYRAC